MDITDWTPSGVTNFIMLAGSSSSITDFDGWMLRNWWYELSRNRGWQSGTSPNPNPPTPNPQCSPLYGQCGGSGWAGAKCCSSGTCKATNEWYSQCV